MRGSGVSNHALQERLDIDPVVDPVREGAEVVVGVLAETERLVAPANYHFEVAQDGVDPGELRQAARLAPADDDNCLLDRGTHRHGREIVARQRLPR